MNHRPVAIGLVLCENVIVEEGTRNVTPVNCFSFRETDSFPGSIDFLLLAWLADGEGKMPTEVVVQRLDSLEAVYRFDQLLTFPDRLRDFRFMARIRDCVFPVAGYYHISLLIDGELVAHRRFRIQRRGG